MIIGVLLDASSHLGALADDILIEPLVLAGSVGNLLEVLVAGGIELFNSVVGGGLGSVALGCVEFASANICFFGVGWFRNNSIVGLAH